MQLYIKIFLAILISISCKFSKPVDRTHIMLPYSFSPSPNPLNFHSAGDWAQCLNNWLPLVTLGSDGSIKPGLANSWSVDSLGLVWRFKLRDNLKWSDGSPIEPSEVIRSLVASRNGTTHTKLKSAIDKIIFEQGEIVFYLNRQVRSLLLEISFVDWAILNPNLFIENTETISNGSPCSGAFCFEFLNNEIGRAKEVKLTKNNNFTLKKVYFEHISLKNFIECKSLIENKLNILAFRTYGQKTSDECLTELKSAGFTITRAVPSWNIKADFLDLGLKEFNINERRYLISAISKMVKNKMPKFGVLRATGIRPSTIDGSLDEMELDLLLDSLEVSKPSINKKIKIVTSELFVGPSLSWLEQSLNSLGLVVELTVLPMSEYVKLFNDDSINKNYHLNFTPLGAGDPDPNMTWRIASKYFYKNKLDESKIDEAFFELDLNKRNEMYKELARDLYRKGLFIPIVVDADWIGIYKDYFFDGLPEFQVGFTGYGIVPK